MKLENEVSSDMSYFWYSDDCEMWSQHSRILAGQAGQKPLLPSSLCLFKLFGPWFKGTWLWWKSISTTNTYCDLHTLLQALRSLQALLFYALQNNTNVSCCRADRKTFPSSIVRFHHTCVCENLVLSVFMALLTIMVSLLGGCWLCTTRCTLLDSIS